MTSADRTNPLSRRRLARVVLLAAGALVTQALVLWPSLFGGKVLLPLDALASPNLYVPMTDPRAHPADMSNADPVVQYEPWRRFAAAEFRAGRIPLWFPYGFAGAPFALWPKYAPFNLLYYARPAATTLVFMHLLTALVASAGAYLFFRRGLRAGFWASAVGAWAYPLTGHFVLWQAFPVPSATAWLPWLMWAAERSARRPRGPAPLVLGLLGGVVLVSGLTDWTLLSLLTAGLYGTWCAWRAHRRRPQEAVRAVAGMAAALAVSALLAAPYLVPMVDYVRSGARYASRIEGRQDRPALGLRALPQVVLPRLYGNSRVADQVYTLPGNRREGAPSAYAGLWLALVLAPWSLLRRPRIVLVPWLALAVLGMAAILGIPGLVQFFRLPFVNLVSYNRFTFATGFGLLCLAVIGLGQVGRRTSARTPLVVSLVLLAVTAAWAAWYRFEIPRAVTDRILSWPYKDFRYTPAQRAGLDEAQRANVTEAGALVLCGAVMAVALARGAGRREWARIALGTLAVGELVAFAARDVQHGDPSLDYPPLANVTRLAGKGLDRVLAVQCLPPSVLAVHGLRDVRGYDAVDPARYIELLQVAFDTSASQVSPDFARSLMMVPRLRLTPEGQADLPGVLDMLGAAHLILPPGPASPGYVVAANPEAMPRAWVPESVRDVGEGAPVLSRLGAPRFDPRRVAFAEGARPLDDVRGQARIAGETAGRVDIDVEMGTPGLLVVSTLWDEGWHAAVSGRPAPLVRTNHALVGVPLEAGPARVVLSYDPPGFRRGVRLMFAGGAAWALAALAVARRRRQAA